MGYSGVTILCSSGYVFFKWKRQALEFSKVMKITADKRLFWFLKERVEIDLSNKAECDMFVQQTLSRGNTSDIMKLHKLLTPQEFSESFKRIMGFLPQEVKKFWEEWFEDINKPSEKNSKNL